jgi:hypothetical protein
VIDFRKIIGSYDPKYPALDPTTPHYEFNSYLECCQSLNIKPSMNRFLAYNRYYKSVIEE